MNHFSEELKRVRLAAGHKMASSFFAWLRGRGVSFNYSYYMRLEKGGLPSEKVVSELAITLEKNAAEGLILAYCQSLFPKHVHLFPSSRQQDDLSISSIPLVASSMPFGQQELTPRQVAVLASSESNYHLFLLSTLARRPILEDEMKDLLSAKVLSSSLKALVSVNLLAVSNRRFESTAIEMRFPDAYTPELKEAYAKFDQWDEIFGKKFALEQLINKMLIRRVSGRYLILVRKQLAMLFELTKTSDEVDDRYNDNVLQLKVTLRQGKLPG